ncbi:MAG: manganese efflux pump, partial [Clostridia bacterium]|nr:manganese efflux pump [Clostridia bacterium]
MWNFPFFLNSILLGVGLAMDAFSVSLANGLHEPLMKKRKICAVAGTFAFFQAAMPLIGWVCVHTVVTVFKNLLVFVPYVALILLGFIGGKMIYDGVKNKEEENTTKLGVLALLVQGVATSIDALSVGFTIAEYDVWHALVSALIIAAITFIICLVGVVLGKKFGTK